MGLLRDFARGGLLGVTTDVLGSPVDLATSVMRPFGYSVPDRQVVGSSDWFASKLGSEPTGTKAEVGGRAITGLLTPSSADVTRVVGLLASALPIVNKMDDFQDLSKVLDVDPKTLVFREDMQNQTERVREMFPPGDGYSPIALIAEPDGAKTILDGHNRAAVAIERGDSLPAVLLTRAEYDKLKSSGFDDMEISYAALTRAGEHEAASSINQQFPGAGVASRGTSAWQELD